MSYPTDYNGVALTGLDLGGSTWYTALDGSWAVQMEGIVPGYEIPIDPGGAPVNLSMQQPANWPSTFPPSGIRPLDSGVGIIGVQNLFTYQAPSAYRATTGGADSPDDATGRLALNIQVVPMGNNGYILDAGPPSRHQLGRPPAGAVIFVQNPLTVPVLLQSVTYTMDLWVQVGYSTPPSYTPPSSPTQPPSGTSTISSTPIATTTRRHLDQANPGYTVRWTRRNRFPDFAAYGLGLRAQLTIPFAGFVNRGNLLTGIQIDYVARIDPVQQDQTAIYTFQKIPGTILPGAGTSTSAQDDAGTGAEVPAYLLIDDGSQGTGIGLGGLG